MSMFSSFDKDLKKADGCLHKAADMFFHPLGEDIFHKWDTNHPAFPGPKLTKVRVECKGKEEKKEVECKKEEVKVTVKVEEKKECKKEVKEVKKVVECKESHSHGCHSSCHSCCCHHHSCHCCKPAPPPPPPAPKPEPTTWRIYPCYKVIDKYAIVESEWCPTMKDYTAEKIWQLHVYLPGADKSKVLVDVVEGKIVVHGEGVFHSHCGMWPEHVEHSCSCTRGEHVAFCKAFAVPPKTKLKDARVEFEAEVLVIRIPRA
ncbi:hypothetical protein FBU59_001210 [Linderina macrospora]|uniref:Uncharacterized protein n=1 Tax=Linderina macrospora TaxID=4868 RepID=A0ACC1JEW8_9FUNG|nr:hypothetical protein FBU59_001210 [Linderina macrospora]